FLGYAAYRYSYPEAFAAGSRHLNLALGAVNTAILLTSSLTMTLAIQAAQEDRRRALRALLLLTMLLGVAFLGVKGVEYSREFEERLVPGLNFADAGPAARQTELFFVLYFLMTGLHALLALLLVTVAAASRDLGPLNAVVALAVAACQALLIVLYLMRVRSSGPLVWVVAGAGFFWLGIMLVLAMSDYVSRGWLGVPG